MPITARWAALAAVLFDFLPHPSPLPGGEGIDRVGSRRFTPFPLGEGINRAGLLPLPEGEGIDRAGLLPLLWERAGVRGKHQGEHHVNQRFQAGAAGKTPADRPVAGAMQ
ncbi:hypothetical protein D3C75_1121560 [compost metagenome]